MRDHGAGVAAQSRDGGDDRLILRLPPPKMPGANSRTHWVVRHRAAKHDRYVASTLALAEMRKARSWAPMQGATLSIVWLGRGRLPDPDNIGGRTKAFIDGLTDAGVWTDDRVVSAVTFATERVRSAADCGILLTVTRTK